MNIFDSVVLGAVQGITEFLPISSSGHLVLAESMLGLKVEALKSFDVAVHVGTLVAILIYFWKDFIGMITFRKGFRLMVLYIVVGMIPAVLAGVMLEDWIDSVFRGAWMVGLMMMITGVVFLAGEGVGKILRSVGGETNLNWWRVLIIGFAQAVALIPGISRSGSTIVAGLFQGIEREKAARFSFLLGAPAIAGAGIWTALKGDLASGLGGGLGSGLGEVDVLPALTGGVIAAVVGFFAIWAMMKFLKKHSLLIFAIYLLVIGSVAIIL
ncbi:MAG: undecaprenyl-diphosphate phosphatase [Candidatus Gracilibacteria bacterium]